MLFAPHAPLARRALASTAVAAGLVLLLAVAAGGVRLVPWLLSPQVAWGTAWPFARGLLAVACETALLAGPPLGWSWAALRSVERGEARALAALGARPLGLAGSTVWAALALAPAIALASASWGADAAAPGRLARALVEQARVACAASTSRRVVDVPLVGLTWLCDPPAAPRLAGRLPGSPVAFTARSASMADDLRSAELSDVRAEVTAAIPVRAHLGAVTVRGLAPWARASTLDPLARAGLLALAAVSCALVAAATVLAGAPRGRPGAVVLGACGPLSALAVLGALERADAAPRLYLLVPLAAVAATLLAAVAARAHAMLRARWLR